MSSDTTQIAAPVSAQDSPSTSWTPKSFVPIPLEKTSTDKEENPDDHTFIGDAKNDIINRWNKEAIPTLARSAYGKDSLQETAWQLATNTGAGSIKDIVGEAAKRLPGAETIGSAVKTGAQSASDAIDSTDAGKWLGDKMLNGANNISEWADNHPGLAADIKGVGNMAGAEGVVTGANTLRNGLADIGENAASHLKRPPDGGGPGGGGAGPAIPKAVQDYNDQKTRNTAYVEGMNANAENMKQSYGNIYGKAGEISQGVNVKAPAIKKTVDSMLEDLQNDPAHNGAQGTSQAFRDLKAVSDSFDSDGNLPLDSATLLKRRLNDLYDPGMGATRGKIYANLNNQMNNVIKQAKVENPEWGAMMDSGNRLFNNYKSTFDTDDMANQKWSLADKKDYEDAQAARINDPYSAPPSTAVRTKIADITSIKSVPQYEAMLRKLPPEMHDQFTQDVIAANKEDNPKLAKAISGVYHAVAGNKFYAAKNLYKAFSGASSTGIDPALAEDFPHVEDAITYHTTNAQGAYKKYMDGLEASQNPPSGPLALPAPGGFPQPPTDIAVGKGGGAAYKTLEQQNMDDVVRQNAAKVGLTPDVMGAQAAQKATAAAQRDRIARYNYERYMGRGSSKLGRDLIENEKNPNVKTYPQDIPPFLKDQFAHGGIVKEKVNTDPTPGQKMAGNYKKAHVKFHGLDISIENPKGSERSGVGKDGKEWHSTMLDHYGYIKRTEGADGDHIDVYLGGKMNSSRVYVIDQKDHDSGKFDEHKVMLGYADRDEATKAYKDAFSDKKNRIMKVTRLTIPEFKAWLKKGNTKQPVRKAA